MFFHLVFDALSGSAIILLRKMAGCFTLIVLWLSVSLPRGVMARSAVCDCDISWSYATFAGNPNNIKPIIFEVKCCICYVNYMAIHVYVSVIIYSI